MAHLPSRAVASVQSNSPADELEDPRAALRYYAGEQIEKVVVEQKQHGIAGDRSSLPKFQNRARKFGGGCGDSR